MITVLYRFLCVFSFVLSASSVFAQNPCTTTFFEPNNYINQAYNMGVQPVGSGVGLTNICLYPNDEDWMAITVNNIAYFYRVTGADSTTSGLYGIQLRILQNGGISVSSTSVGGVTTDTKLYLYDANGLQLAYNDDTTPGSLLSTIVYTPTVTTSSLQVSSTSFTPLGSGGATTVTVTTNTRWSVAAVSGNWISASPSSGVGNGVITLTVGVNPYATPRASSINVTGGGITRNISVVQPILTSNCTDPAEPNNISLTSTSLGTISTTYNDTSYCLSSVTDNDWFSFNAFGTTHYLLVKSPSTSSARGQYGLNISIDSSNVLVINTFGVPNSNGNGDTYIALYDVRGVLLGSDDNSAGNNFSRLIYEAYAPTLSLSTSSIRASSFGGSYTTYINMSNSMPWSAASTSPWLTVSPASGSGTTFVTINFAPSNVTGVRGGRVNFTSGRSIVSFVATQTGNRPPLDIRPNSLNFLASGNSLSSNIFTSGAWSISGVPAWATASATTGRNNSTVTFSTTPNPNSTSRSAAVTVTGGGTTRTILLSQLGSPYFCNDAAEPNDSSGNATVLGTIASTYINNLYCLSAGDHDWFSFSLGGVQYFAEVRGFNASVSGPYGLSIRLDNGALVVNTFRSTSNGQTTDTWLTLLDANGTILGQNDDAGGTLFSSIRHNLSPPILVAMPSSINCSDLGGTFNVSVTAPASTSWTASTTSTWFQVSVLNGTITIAISANRMPVSRNGLVIITDGVSSTPINVSQLGAFQPFPLTITPRSMSFSSNGGSMSTAINTPCSWTVTNAPNWVTLSSNSGIGVTRLSVSASANSATVTRSGTIQVMACGVSYSIFVSQAAFTPPVPTPANDLPCNAIAIAIDTVCSIAATFTNAGATTDSIARGSCGNTAISGDVWFTFTVPASGQFTVSGVAGTLRDGIMSVYTGTCNQLTYVTCNDDISATNLMPLINSNSATYTPGSTVWVRYWGFMANNGTFGVCVREGIFANRSAVVDNTPKGNINSGLTGEMSTFVVYPNPSLDAQFNIVLDNQGADGEAQIQLIDLQGRVIREMNRPVVSGENLYRFENTELSNGLYMVRMQLAGKSLFTLVTIAK